MSNIELPDQLIGNYLSSLVNQFFKILPLKESNEKSLPVYIKSLQREIIGFKSLVDGLGYDRDIIVLLSILEYMILEDPDVSIVKAEVFRAINICKKLNERFEEVTHR